MEKYSPFSNFHQANITVDYTVYCSTEQYYHAKKAELFKDDNSYTQIMASTDSVEIMKLGKQVEDFKPAEWAMACDDVMYIGNMAKYTQIPELKAKLLSTGEKALVESSKHDKYWGSGIALNDKNALKKDLWVGENKMGMLLVKIRSEIV